MKTRPSDTHIVRAQGTGFTVRHSYKNQRDKRW